MAALSHVTIALVIEDDHLLAIDLAQTLERHGCLSVLLAGDMVEALARISVGIDFATVDVKLRGHDCAEVVSALVASATPFVYVSAYSANDHPVLPEAPWVSKPFSEESLLEAIATVCRVAV